MLRHSTLLPLSVEARSHLRDAVHRDLISYDMSVVADLSSSFNNSNSSPMLETVIPIRDGCYFLIHDGPLVCDLWYSVNGLVFKKIEGNEEKHLDVIRATNPLNSMFILMKRGRLNH